ncbi:MAG TPA: ATP-binding protein [Bacteriovoracaceae bacterium]|nr:ATP-binding protein [Bacteriovoracaceae bacterium]
MCKDSRSVDLNPTQSILAAIETVIFLEDKKSIQIETDIDTNIGTVMGDTVRLQQVIWNLLTNAIKFSEPHSKVIVSAKKVGKELVIKVMDEGKGIAPDYLPFIFDRFSQEDASSERLHGGLGLGLAIVRNLVELQGSTITAANLSGKGSFFTVRMPLTSLVSKNSTLSTKKKEINSG